MKNIYLGKSVCQGVFTIMKIYIENKTAWLMWNELPLHGFALVAHFTHMRYNGIAK